MADWPEDKGKDTKSNSKLIDFDALRVAGHLTESISLIQAMALAGLLALVEPRHNFFHVTHLPAEAFWWISYKATPCWNLGDGG